MKDIEDRVAELEHYRDNHEAEHQNLRDHLERELRSKWASDIKAMSVHYDKLLGPEGELRAHLAAQDQSIEHIEEETKKQTPLLKKASKQLRMSAKERHDRKVEERQYRLWMKRLAGAVASIVLLAEAWDKWEHVVKIFHH
jgi:chromosome segregation ATPase